MKYKSMLYLTISYVPWVVYWTLSAIKVKYGTLIMFLIAFTYLLVERYKRDISLMDSVALGYSFLAIVTTYGLNSTIFIKGDGYLGYGTLFLMGVISKKKQPFIQYYVKKDFGPSNNVCGLIHFINKVWIAIFGISTLIFIFIDKPVIAVLTSNLFVLFGVIFSIKASTKKSEEIQ